MSRRKLLEIRNLRVTLDTMEGAIHAVDGVSLYVCEGEKVGLVGESGSGKSLTGKATLQLISGVPHVIAGQVLYNGVDILQVTPSQLREIRGGQIAMVFQDPMTYLNPSMRVGKQIAENANRRGARKKDANSLRLVDETLRMVGLSPETGVARKYPYELSGGMRQRVLMAIGLARKPRMMIADEPTTALDVTVQAQVLKTLNDLTDELDMGLLLITHDMGVVAALCDRVYVMYAGEIVETADSATLFSMPAHPYTRGLLNAVPSVDKFQETLHTIPGSVPDPIDMPSGCRFRDRCPVAMPKCVEDPPFFRVSGEGTARCWLYADEESGLINEGDGRDHTVD